MHGSLTVIAGPMFAGKSTELERRLRRAEIAGQSVLRIRPKVDHLSKTHDGKKLGGDQLTDLSNLDQWWKALDRPEVIGIDEFQFFDQAHVHCMLEIMHYGGSIIVAGVDIDQEGSGFKSFQQVMPLADEIVKLTAVCTECRRHGRRGEATRSMWTSREPYNAQTRVGGADRYEPRCLSCFIPYTYWMRKVQHENRSHC